MKIIASILIVLTLGACCAQETAIVEPIVAEEVMTKF